jgi:hypothetical protein
MGDPPFIFVEQVAEFLPPAMESNLGGGDGDPELLADLLV